ncbi:MAG: argininosuccinate lyase [Deltaproteobacteria bacterium]|jgi:argininosuccinate lyase|nr:argininosuccinate lyase [Deltaproteobacteria bacterium]
MAAAPPRKANPPAASPAAPARHLAGRLSGKVSSVLARASVSVGFDRALAREDIWGSLAHARALLAIGALSGEDFRAIQRGLGEIRAEIGSGAFHWDEALEDVHMNIEKALIAKAGEAGAKLHAGRSRNDQVATDELLFLKKTALRQRGFLLDLREALLARAEEVGEALAPGYTHLQRAQPVLLAHWLLAHQEAFARDADRFLSLEGRLKWLPLGSGALAGTSLPIDPEIAAAALGFASPARNSLDAVSSRDALLEYLAFAAILAVNLSRLAEEMALWSSAEFGFLSFPDSLATTSSMMPQKKNPDGAELLRGKAGRVIGSLVSLLVVVKGLPLSYNRDLQEDKEPFLDAASTLDLSLPLAASLAREATFNLPRLREAASDPFMAATDVAEALVLRGTPFREAHREVGALVAFALERGISLLEVTPEDFLSFCPQGDPALLRRLGPEDLTRARGSTLGGTAPERVRENLARASARALAERERLIAEIRERDLLLQALLETGEGTP